MKIKKNFEGVNGVYNQTMDAFKTASDDFILIIANNFNPKNNSVVKSFINLDRKEAKKLQKKLLKFIEDGN